MLWRQEQRRKGHGIIFLQVLCIYNFFKSRKVYSNVSLQEGLKCMEGTTIARRHWPCTNEWPWEWGGWVWELIQEPMSCFHIWGRGYTLGVWTQPLTDLGNRLVCPGMSEWACGSGKKSHLERSWKGSGCWEWEQEEGKALRWLVFIYSKFMPQAASSELHGLGQGWQPAQMRCQMESFAGSFFHKENRKYVFSKSNWKKNIVLWCRDLSQRE